jgi:hypothetical protein
MSSPLTDEELEECPPELQAVGEQLVAVLRSHERRCVNITKDEEERGYVCHFKDGICKNCCNTAMHWMMRYAGFDVVEIVDIREIGPEESR